MMPEREWLPRPSSKWPSSWAMTCPRITGTAVTPNYVTPGYEMLMRNDLPLGEPLLSTHYRTSSAALAREVLRTRLR